MTNFAIISDVTQPASWSRGDLLTVVGIIVTIVIALLGGILASIIGLFSKSAELKSDVKHITNDVGEIKGDFKDVRIQVDKIPHLEKRFDQLWAQTFSKAHSPVQLNEFGQQILESSKGKDLFEKYVEGIYEKVKEAAPENAYQAQTKIIEAFKALKDLPEIKSTIEEGAFNSGVDPETVLTVAAIFFRDRILEKLGFDGKQINEINTI